MSEFSAKALDRIIKGRAASFKENARSFIFTCPKCLKKDKLYIAKSTGQFICWYCAEKHGFRGRCEYALAELYGEQAHIFRLELYGSAEIGSFRGGWLPDIHTFFDHDDSEEEEEFEETESLQWPWNFYPIAHEFSKPGLAYLGSRGITQSVAELYDIRYCPMYSRVYFPLKVDGILLGWQGRNIRDNAYWNELRQRWVYPLKILSSDNIPRSNYVMFSGRITGNYAVLCEGPIDALKAHLCGANVCTMGKIVTPQQLNFLVNMGIERIYVALDPDAGEEIQALIQKLPGIEFYNMIAPAPYEDIGMMTMEQVKDLFDKAEPMNAGHIYSQIAKPNFC